jgi:Flp pilus assembly protein TadG
MRTIRRLRADERGIALVYMALTLVVMIMFAAIAIDLGNAREQQADAQSAADAAALSGAQALVTSSSTQPTTVFDDAAQTAFHSLSLDGVSSSIRAAGGTNCPAGQTSTCYEYDYTTGGILYAVTVTSPYTDTGSPNLTPDTLVHITACWGVPTTFGRVIGQTSIKVCGAATAQNGVATPGTSNSGCGNTNAQFSSITNTFSAAIGSQQIKAVYGGTLAQTDIDWVVQDANENLFELDPPGTTGDSASQMYSITTSGGTTTLTYTLPTNIDARPTANSAVENDEGISTTFSSALQVLDPTGATCGNASWTTCNPLKTGETTPHDPIFDGGSVLDITGWGLGSGGAATPDDGGSNEAGVAGSGLVGDGHDVNSDEYNYVGSGASTQATGRSISTDSDDTVTPKVGTLVNAGNPVGAIYNDENPLRAGSVNFLVDGTEAPFSSATTWANVPQNDFAFTDPSTAYNYQTSTNTSGVNPTLITGMPSFGTVSTTTSGITITSATPPIKFYVTLYDAMGNPLPGYQVTASNGGGTQTTYDDGTTGTFTYNSVPPAGTTIKWSGTNHFTGATDSGTLFTYSGASLPATPNPNAGAAWPSFANTKGKGSSQPQGESYGNSVGIMFNSSALTTGWHSAVLFANDGDVTTSGGDCSIVTWAFASQGGPAGAGSLHLID